MIIICQLSATIYSNKYIMFVNFVRRILLVSIKLLSIYHHKQLIYIMAKFDMSEAINLIRSFQNWIVMTTSPHIRIYHLEWNSSCYDRSGCVAASTLPKVLGFMLKNHQINNILTLIFLTTFISISIFYFAFV